MSIFYLISSLYLISSILYGIYLWSQNNKISKLGFYIGLTAIILHTFKLANIFFTSDVVETGVIRTLFIFAWLIGIVYLISQIKFKAVILGAFILPIIFICTLPSLIIPPGIIDNDPTIKNPWILIHIILIFLGEAFFVVSFISGLIYIFEENQIKSKKISGYLNKFPSLIKLDRINHFSLLLGFPFLTIGLAIGFILAKEILAENWIWGAKETLSTVTWLLYALLINGRLNSGWKGKKSAMFAVFGFVIILITFLVGYILPG
ncbi:MAG: hypothetical protein GTO02_11605 [Candidatus Dadabacteria bacterium]|nr:hypothetical protein [Candidatus Dadabacteria bacterium]NIQ15001.1 hypothetical protein [Candidatus Dadabacteria bacterium]